jgi:hypothetical protein
MVPRSHIPLLALLLIGSVLLAGCGQKAVRPGDTPAGTTAATPRPYTQVQGTTLASTTPVPATPVPTPVVETFPDALSLGTPYRYGREDISVEATAYRVRTMKEYNWWSPNWGRGGNTTAKTGHHFIFVFVRFIDRGSARALLPTPHALVLKSGGNSYIETTDRDNSIPITEFNVKQYEYYFEDVGGWIAPGYSNRIEGFILYEVPESVTPANSYLHVIFSGKANATWKLG